jgi:putative cardiolipin synthase
MTDCSPISTCSRSAPWSRTCRPTSTAIGTAPRAYPAERILPAVEPERIAEIAEAAAASARAPAARDYLEAIRTLPFVARVEAGAMEFEWAPARMVSDDPAKALGEAEPHELLSHALAGVLGAPRREVALVSGYFVPTTASVEAFADLAGRGVEVSILTNSWAATDVAVVHAGYAGRRKALLRPASASTKCAAARTARAPRTGSC